MRKGCSSTPETSSEGNFTFPLFVTIKRVTLQNILKTRKTLSRQNWAKYAPHPDKNVSYDIRLAQYNAELLHCRSGDTRTHMQNWATIVDGTRIPLELVIKAFQMAYWLRIPSTVGISRRAVYLDLLCTAIGYATTHTVFQRVGSDESWFMTVLIWMMWIVNGFPLIKLMILMKMRVSFSGRFPRIVFLGLDREERKSDRADAQFSWGKRLCVSSSFELFFFFSAGTFFNHHVPLPTLLFYTLLVDRNLDRLSSRHFARNRYMDCIRSVLLLHVYLQLSRYREGRIRDISN